MADSIDILTKDEQHVRIFAEGLKLTNVFQNTSI